MSGVVKGGANRGEDTKSSVSIAFLILNSFYKRIQYMRQQFV